MFSKIPHEALCPSNPITCATKTLSFENRKEKARTVLHGLRNLSYKQKAGLTKLVAIAPA